MKKLLTSIGIALLSFFVGGFVFALEQPDSFQVEVSPSTFQVNQPVDITIKAIKNGQVMKGYEGTVFFEIVGDVALHEYVVPNGGLGDINLTDQGVKTYSKGLQLKKSGNFILKVSDLMVGDITGQTTIIVHSDKQVNLRPIEILSPLQNGKESDSVMSVMANAPDLANSRIQIYLNDLMVVEGMTDDNGLITENVPIQKAGTNVLELKAVAVDNQVVGISEKRTFLYEPLDERLFKKIQMTPNENLKIGDRVNIDVITEDRVSSAKLIFSGGQEYPLDKEKDGLFVKKELMLTQTGEMILNAEMSAGPISKKYDNVLTFTVKDHLKIGEVKISVNPNEIGTLDLSWKTIGGEAKDYAIKYGLKKDDLQGIVFTTEPQASLSGFSYGKSYFFQILATTPDHIPEGLPSEVIQFDLPILSGTQVSPGGLTENKIESEPDHPAPVVVDKPTCVVKNIQLQTKKIGNKRYLTRDAVQNIEKYMIYVSDFADGSDKKFVAETEYPRFEYPFDTSVEEDIYAYYSVEGICKDGERLIIAEAEKVQVGPLEDMLLILTATFLIYLMYKLYNYHI